MIQDVRETVKRAIAAEVALAARERDIAEWTQRYNAVVARAFACNAGARVCRLLTGACVGSRGPIPPTRARAYADKVLLEQTLADVDEQMQHAVSRDGTRGADVRAVDLVHAC